VSLVSGAWALLSSVSRFLEKPDNAFLKNTVVCRGGFSLELSQVLLIFAVTGRSFIFRKLRVIPLLQEPSVGLVDFLLFWSKELPSFSHPLCNFCKRKVLWFQFLADFC
jgi:hypothetical protein